MKHLKILGLLAMAVIGLIALPADATATGSVLCTVQESPCPEANLWTTGTELDFTLKSGTKAVLVETNAPEGEGKTLDSCSSSTAKGKLENAEPVTGPIESLTWSSCTFQTKTLNAGKLKVEHIAGTHNGTVKSDGITEVTVNTVLFGSCIYGATAGVDLGELKEGKPATFVANAVLQKLSGVVCPGTAKWTAEYTLTEPGEKTLSVEVGAAYSVFCTVQESPCPEGNLWSTGTELDFSVSSGSSVQLTQTGGSALDKCTGSTAKGKLESTEPVTSPIESLSWSGCTFPTKTLTLGKLTIEHIPGTHNGTVKSDGITEVTVNTVLFGSCIYGVKVGDSLGDLTEGNPAVFHLSAVATKQSGSMLGCPETANLTGTYTLTEPGEKTLSVEVG
jgi:hypothetical protein